MRGWPLLAAALALPRLPAWGLQAACRCWAAKAAGACCLPCAGTQARHLFRRCTPGVRLARLPFGSRQSYASAVAGTVVVANTCAAAAAALAAARPYDWLCDSLGGYFASLLYTSVLGTLGTMLLVFVLLPAAFHFAVQVRRPPAAAAPPARFATARRARAQGAPTPAHLPAAPSRCCGAAPPPRPPLPPPCTQRWGTFTSVAEREHFFTRVCMTWELVFFVVLVATQGWLGNALGLVTQGGDMQGAGATWLAAGMPLLPRAGHAPPPGNTAPSRRPPPAAAVTLGLAGHSYLLAGNYCIGMLVVRGGGGGGASTASCGGWGAPPGTAALPQPQARPPPRTAPPPADGAGFQLGQAPPADWRRGAHPGHPVRLQ